VVQTSGVPHHLVDFAAVDVGAALARLEGRVVLDEVLKRWPDWEVDDANARLTDGFLTRGYETLPVFV
jgi:cytochrome P450